jgi:two-component system nitrate/nitrite response regulator NarL
MTEGLEDLMQAIRDDIAALRADIQQLHPIDGHNHVTAAIPQFTPRQHVILKRLCRGESNKQIGRVINLPESTIKVHVREIMRKMSVNNRTQVAIVAASMRLI